MDTEKAALFKLADYVASGIGSVAGPMLAAWRAKREAEATKILAQGDADALIIAAEGQATAMQTIADAQIRTQETLASSNFRIEGELNIAETIAQRIQFQEAKRQNNIASVVQLAADELEDKSAPNHEPDHDWTARFFGDVQDVSSEEMQTLWAKVLAGEVEQPGSTSIKTLGILRNLDRTAARHFEKLCSLAVILDTADDDARVPSLGGDAAQNALQKYGLPYGTLNLLNEHGLITSSYNSWKDYKISIGIPIPVGNPQVFRAPFRYQGRYWVLVPNGEWPAGKEFRLSGVALTQSGKELVKIVSIPAVEDFTQDLKNYFTGQGFQMMETHAAEPHVVPTAR